MPSSFNFSISRRTRLIVVFILIVLAGYFVVRFFFVSARNVPTEFLEARSQASATAAEIVSFSNQTSDNLSKVAEFDNKKDYTNALVLVSNELERNREAREKAVSLSAELQTMTQKVSSISPQSAGQKALEALASETALVSSLITYNEYLNELLETLRGKFVDRPTGENIPALIAKINAQARVINDLNEKFNNTMKEFDGQ